MLKYKNLMETLVEDKYDDVKDSLACCPCEECRNDIIALTLNQLPTKYVVSIQGVLYSKLSMLGAQYSTDVIAALTRASEIVGTHPRHPIKTN